MTAATFVFLIGLAGSLFLASRALRSDGLSFENKAWMAVVWAAIIAVLAFLLGWIGA